VVNINNNAQLVSFLQKSVEARSNFVQEKRKEFAATHPEGELPEDTASERDFHETSSEESKKSKSEPSVMSSKYSHSRFSSNIQDDFEDLQPVEIQPLLQNIDGQPLHVSLPDKEKLLEKVRKQKEIKK
jgi:hypothetical protein